ncbi:MAG: phospholipid carrier-dependent glycosyltransferase [Chloroflexota bacterium]
MAIDWQKGEGWIWAKTAVLLIMFTLATLSLQNKAPTFDEQSYITRGLGYLRGENRHMRVGHPLGMNALSASLLVTDDSTALPTDDLSWPLTSFHRPSELFMWEIGNDVEKVIFLGRLPTIWLTMLLVSLVGRWCWELTRQKWASVVAMSFIAFDPNILAHGRLATTDLALTFGATLAGWLLWRFFKRPSWQAIAFAAVGFAILQNTKFTAGLYVPLFAIVIVFGLICIFKEERREKREEREEKRKERKESNLQSPIPKNVLLPLLVGYPLIGFVALWAMYGFQIGTLPDSLPTVSQLSGMTVPLAHHLEQLLDIGGRLQKSTPAFMLGNYSDSGWWSYFLVAFGVKTPLATLLLIGMGLFLTGRRWIGEKKTAVSLFDTAALLVPSLGFFAIALTTDINLGYRQILPVVPFLIIWAVRELTISNRPITQSPNHPIILTLFLLFTAVFNFPHYLPFFNIFAGGPSNGYRTLVDSNIDWGQDLPLLKEWMDENGVSRVWLSYFGEARPDYYGINYVGLDSFPPRLMHPDTRPFYPEQPAAGIYAISATTLQGVHFANHEQFVYFQAQAPIAKLGHSIFLYLVEAEGEPIELILDEIQLDAITAVDIEMLNSNQFELHWLYGGNTLYFPADAKIEQKEVWVATRNSEDWLSTGDWALESQNDDYDLLRLVTPPNLETPLTFQWRKAEKTIFMSIDWRLNDNLIEIDSRLSHDAQPENVRQFIHFANDQDEILTQWDGLDTAWQGWQAGDRLLQSPTLMVPPNLPAGLYQMWTGLYNPETGERYTIGLGDERLLLGVFEVDESGIKIVMNGAGVQVASGEWQVSGGRYQVSGGRWQVAGGRSRRVKVAHGKVTELNHTNHPIIQSSNHPITQSTNPLITQSRFGAKH